MMTIKMFYFSSFFGMCMQYSTIDSHSSDRVCSLKIKLIAAVTYQTQERHSWRFL